MDTVFFTLVIAAFAGISIFVISHKLHLPAIVLLLLGGVVLGPEGLGLIHTAVLGENLRMVISLCVAIILFEGGLTLKPEGFKNASKIIWLLLTVGVAITWLGTAFFIKIIYHQLPIEICLLAGSLVIVTGPTVITPLLKKINVKENLYNILHWEGVLIDPIGVFIAVLCFEWITLMGTGDLTSLLIMFATRLTIGFIFGVLGGQTLAFLLKKNYIPENQSNIFVFASVLLMFVGSDSIVHESGLLTVIIAGLVVSSKKIQAIEQLKNFKSELTELSIALIFILLAAKLELNNFIKLGGFAFALIAAVLLLVRPLSIFLCTFGSSLNIRERLFLSWIAPRGVIAGSMASLFGVTLLNSKDIAVHPDHAMFLETFTFSIIASTIVLQGLSANKIAQFLKVKEKDMNIWLLVGAHDFSWKIAKFIEKTSHSKCIFVDSNNEAIKHSKKRGFTAIKGNALSTDIQIPGWSAITHILALTDNKDLNQLTCENWGQLVDHNNLYWWAPSNSNNHSTAIGNPIWTSLIKPSEVSYELRNKTALLSKKPLHSQGKTSQCLISHENNQFHFATSNNQSQLPLENTIYFQHYSFKLSTYLTKDHVLIIKNSDENLFTAAHNEFQKIYPELPFEDIIESIKIREKDLPTIIAPGVVVPHVHIPHIKEPYCFLVLFTQEYLSPYYGSNPLRLAFFLLSPEDMPELHLIMLGEIAKSLSNPENIDKLTQARSTTEVVQIFTEIENN